MENKLGTVDYIRTFSGINFHFLNPTEDEIKIEDIAHSLSMLCRFNGHTSEFYSVASHSIIGTELIDEKFKLEMICHDMAESYFSDVPTPAKSRLPEIKELEKTIEKVINKKIGIPYPMSKEVKEMDNLMFRMEWVYLMNGENTTNEVFPLTKKIFMSKINKTHKEVEFEFLDMFYILQKT